MIPDPAVSAGIRAQLARLEQLENRLSARCTHPPAIGVRGWGGPAADAHRRAAEGLRIRLIAAEEAVLAAIAATRAALVRVGG